VSHGGLFYRSIPSQRCGALRGIRRWRGSTVAQYGGEVLVFDVAAETMEGVSPGPQTVVIKFESTEAAKAWYESAEYQAVVGKRLSATEGFSVLSQSMNAG